MRIVVLGAGALGAYYGGRLEEAGADVTFLVRGRRAEQIRINGIRLHSSMGEYTIENPKIILDAKEVKQVDLVLVGVKGYHLEGAMESLRVLAKKGAYILPVLNGIEHISRLQDELGNDAVLGGLAFIFSTLDEAGHVVHSGDFHNLIFGPLETTQQSICKELEKLTDRANFNGINTPGILHELWKKYMFINALSGITTAANLPMGPIQDVPETFRVAEMILQEMKQLANAYKVAITDEEVEEARNKMLHLDKEATSSMHQDRRKGLILEVDHLHGGAVRLAKAAGIDMPYTEVILGLIKPFEIA